jgi:hypothetical protein
MYNDDIIGCFIYMSNFISLRYKAKYETHTVRPRKVLLVNNEQLAGHEHLHGKEKAFLLLREMDLGRLINCYSASVHQTHLSASSSMPYLLHIVV